MFRISTPQSHGQLDTGVLIAQQSDVYEEIAKLSGNSLPALRFLMQLIFIEAQLKKAKLGVLACFSQHFDGNSSHCKSEKGR